MAPFTATTLRFSMRASSSSARSACAPRAHATMAPVSEMADGVKPFCSISLSTSSATTHGAAPSVETRHEPHAAMAALKPTKVSPSPFCARALSSSSPDSHCAPLRSATIADDMLSMPSSCISVSSSSARVQSPFARTPRPRPSTRSRPGSRRRPTTRSSRRRARARPRRARGSPALAHAPIAALNVMVLGRDAASFAAAQRRRAPSPTACRGRTPRCGRVRHLGRRAARGVHRAEQLERRLPLLALAARRDGRVVAVDVRPVDVGRLAHLGDERERPRAARRPSARPRTRAAPWPRRSTRRSPRCTRRCWARRPRPSSSAAARARDRARPRARARGSRRGSPASSAATSAPRASRPRASRRPAWGAARASTRSSCARSASFTPGRVDRRARAAARRRARARRRAHEPRRRDAQREHQDERLAPFPGSTARARERAQRVLLHPACDSFTKMKRHRGLRTDKV